MGVLHVLSESAAGLMQYLPDVAADLLVQVLRMVELGSLEIKTQSLKTLSSLVSSHQGKWKANVSGDKHNYSKILIYQTTFITVVSCNTTA